MINPKESKGFEWTQTDVGNLYSLLGPVQMISGHILLWYLEAFLHCTAAERRGGAPAWIQAHVAVSGVHVPADHRHHAHLRAHAVGARVGGRARRESRVGAVVRHLRDLRAVIRCAYLSVYCRDCDDLQWVLPRLPRHGERHRTGVRVAGPFHRGRRGDWSRRGRRSPRTCTRGVSSIRIRGRSILASCSTWVTGREMTCSFWASCSSRTRC